MQDKKPDVPVSDDSNLVIVTTPDYVKESIKEAIAEHAASRNHPDATLQDKGFVVLSNDVGSDSETMAATPKAVKAAYDLANTANQNATNWHMDGSSLPVGVPVPWPTENPPEGWLICNGESFDKAMYPKLTLAYPSGVLPDLRGEFIRGLDTEGTIAPDRTLLSKQQATMLPSMATCKYSSSNGVLVSPPVSSYSDNTNTLASDYEDPTILPENTPYFSAKLAPYGAVGLASFRVRPRNIAFNYIVRAA